MTKVTLPEWIHDAIVRYNGNHADRRALQEVIRAAVDTYPPVSIGKPRIYITRHPFFCKPVWYCSSKTYCGFGYTPETAYLNWKARSNELWKI